MAGTALCELRSADFVAGTALCEPRRSADFVPKKRGEKEVLSSRRQPCFESRLTDMAISAQHSQWWSALSWPHGYVNLERDIARSSLEKRTCPLTLRAVCTGIATTPFPSTTPLHYNLLYSYRCYLSIGSSVHVGPGSRWTTCLSFPLLRLLSVFEG